MKQKYKYHWLNKNGFMQIDFAFAVLIFFLFFITISGLYNSEISNQKKILEISELEITARDICEIIIKTSGVPMDWENDINSIKMIGLKNIENNSLNVNKVNKFNNTYYSNFIQNTLPKEFIYYITITNLKDNLVKGNIGYEPKTNSKIGVFNCYSNYGGNKVRVGVKVWK